MDRIKYGIKYDDDLGYVLSNNLQLNMCDDASRNSHICIKWRIHMYVLKVIWIDLFSLAYEILI